MTSLRRRLDALVPEILRVTATPGASVAARAGSEHVTRAYGLADVEAGGAMTTESVFPLGSMSKLYTAIAVLQLVERDLVRLDDSVIAHPHGGRAVTVRDLLTFRSGLATDTTHSGFAAPPELAVHVDTALAADALPEYGGAVPAWSARAGERYGYSNLGVATLGRVVEARNPDGLCFADYVERRIMHPLGMRRSRFGDWREEPALVPGYMGFGPRVVRSPLIRSADFPANGLVGVPGDHRRLLEALADGGGELLTAGSVEAMLEPQVRVGGDGPLWPGGEWWTGLIAILRDPGGPAGHFGHPGSHTWGWWSVSRAYPELDCTVAVSVNRWDMMRWHNPANPEAAVLIADAIGRWAATRERPPAQERPWSWKRGYVAATVVAERTLGLLGIGSIPRDATDAMARSCDAAERDGFLAGLAAAPHGPLRPEAASALFDAPAAIPAEELETLLLDLGAVYGFPVPLWFWDPPVSAP
jgi:CubicO group peptidase (beta-lactamase class C family)